MVTPGRQSSPDLLTGEESWGMEEANVMTPNFRSQVWRFVHWSNCPSTGCLAMNKMLNLRLQVRKIGLVLKVFLEHWRRPPPPQHKPTSVFTARSVSGGERRGQNEVHFTQPLSITLGH